MIKFFTLWHCTVYTVQLLRIKQSWWGESSGKYLWCGQLGLRKCVPLPYTWPCSKWTYWSCSQQFAWGCAMPMICLKMSQNELHCLHYTKRYCLTSLTVWMCFIPEYQQSMQMWICLLWYTLVSQFSYEECLFHNTCSATSAKLDMWGFLKADRAVDGRVAV